MLMHALINDEENFLQGFIVTFLFIFLKKIGEEFVIFSKQIRREKNGVGESNLKILLIGWQHIK